MDGKGKKPEDNRPGKKENGYRHEILSKSNLFIGTKYKASAMENKITYLAMLKIQRQEFDNRPDGVYVSMTAGEIRKATGYKGGSLYENLMHIADQMTGNNMGIVNESRQSFEFITLINRAKYEDGIFTIKFANEFKENLIDVHTDFTKIPKKIVMAFQKPWSFPLYQLLKSQCFYPASYTGIRNNVFIVEIGLSELKLDIGVVNANQTDVRILLSRGTGTEADYDKAVKLAEGSKEARFSNYNDFSERCLNPTIKEINELSDIYVEYKKMTRGRGGKVRAIEFTVFLEGAQNKNPAPNPVTYDGNGEIIYGLSDTEKFMTWHDILNLTAPYGFSFDQAIRLAEAAGYDMARINQAVEVLKAQSCEILNPFGFLLSAIRGEWKNPDKKTDNSFLSFEQTDYDFDRLEKDLLANEGTKNKAVTDSCKETSTDAPLTEAFKKPVSENEKMQIVSEISSMLVEDGLYDAMTLMTSKMSYIANIATEADYNMEIIIDVYENMKREKKVPDPLQYLLKEILNQKK